MDIAPAGTATSPLADIATEEVAVWRLVYFGKSRMERAMDRQGVIRWSTYLGTNSVVYPDIYCTLLERVFLGLRDNITIFSGWSMVMFIATVVFTFAHRRE